MGFKDKLENITKAMKPGTEVKNLLEVYASEVGNILEYQDKDIKWIRGVLERQAQKERSAKIISFISLCLSIITILVVVIWKV